MASGCGAPAEVLLERPWLPVCISDCQLLAKTWFGETAYHILLTDMHCVWEERMDSAAIQRRSQELNRRLRAPVKAFFSHLCEVVQPCLSGCDDQSDGEAQVTLMHREDGGDISMRLKSELAGLPFYWEFHCSPAPVGLVCGQLVRPLLLTSRLLQRQVEQLANLLVRKDAEIQDYRENGATLSRERLQTEVFEEQTYREDFIAKALPQVCSGQQEGLGFDADLRDLYTAIVTHGNALSHKRKLSETHPGPEDDQTAAATAEEPDLTSTPGDGAVSGQPDGDGEGDDEGDAGEAKMADRPAEQRQVLKGVEINSSPAATEDPAERSASRPKKKKAMGLFR
ncbi:non-homologous end-joining factor 1 [Diretmus argenteus]